MLHAEDVFITDDLARRAPKRIDHLREKLALHELAKLMAYDPVGVLPRFVDLAMQITGGVSGGLSLYEPDPAPGVFRWSYLRGILSRFEGATTPRDFSPCGMTLDRDEPVLSRHPERAYDWISDAGIVVPEVLLVPLYIGSKEPLGTLWIVSDEDEHFDKSDARAMTELASFVGIALQMVRGERVVKQALEKQETLTKEMNHRVKNLFSLVDGMIRLTAKSTTTSEEMALALSGRLHALARAHSLIQRASGARTQNSGGSELATLLLAIVEPHDNSPHLTSRFWMSGPTVPCGEQATNCVALLFHELVTNAAKYGALSSNDGHVEINWHFDGDRLILGWKEEGGPSIVETPEGQGFGVKLVDSTVKQLSGDFDRSWTQRGLVATLRLPLSSLTK